MSSSDKPKASSKKKKKPKACKPPPKALRDLAAGYKIGSFAQDLCRMQLNPGPGQGDGWIYIVQDFFGQYIAKDNPDDRTKGGIWTTSARDHAKLFYDGQTAWRWATRMMYPALPIRIGPDEAHPDYA